jgi:hypothetical protein
MTIEVTNIDWEELARRYTEKTKRDISFQGSTAYIPYIKDNTVILDIDLYVTSSFFKMNHEKLFGQESRFCVDLDASGNLSYTEKRHQKVRPPNSKTLIIENKFILFNILSDYIEPFIHSTSLPVLLPRSTDPSLASSCEFVLTTHHIG